MDHTTPLPHGLAGVLNRPDEQRDSAYYSNMDPSSKHTSTQSTNGHHILTPPTSSYQSSVTDHTPSPIALQMNQPLPSPGSGSMSVASMVSPTTDQSMLRRLDHRQSTDSGTMANGDTDSRRQSVNSQLGLGDLRLANSPYASNNQSTTSIQSTLQQQRHPGGVERNSSSRFSQSWAPNCTTAAPAQGQRGPPILPEPLSPGAPRHGRQPMVGPIITGPTIGRIARATEPVPGEAWAFPEEEVVRIPSGARPSTESDNRQGTSFLDSRRNSIADSISSSIYTTDSRFPASQRRFDDGTTPDQQRNSRASSDFQSHHHHHTLQNRQVSDLQSDTGSVNGNQPYSRTPELRVSHKLAERKRRTEMKELFDNLRDLMPQERGSKASKWEILTKAIHEYGRLQDALNKERKSAAKWQHDIDGLVRENERVRLENNQLHAQLAQFERTNGGNMDTAPHMIPNGNYASHNTGSQQLPPLRMNSNSDSMSGVQYQQVQHDPRVNGSYAHRF